MKNKFIIAVVITFSAIACVQQAFLKTVVVTLTVKNKKRIEKVGIRGNGNPLSWNQDFLMKEVIKDSVYTATLTTMSAYRFAEIKFTLNGEWELKDKPNRVVYFSDKSDTTIINAIYDVP